MPTVRKLRCATAAEGLPQATAHNPTINARRFISDPSIRSIFGSAYCIEIGGRDYGPLGSAGSFVRNCVEVGSMRLIRPNLLAHWRPLHPICDRDFAAAQDVAIGHFRTHAAQQTLHTAVMIYSINSSARPLSESGTAMPKVLAVLRLMMSSTLVDC
jgi:hypothetical protein